LSELKQSNVGKQESSSSPKVEPPAPQLSSINLKPSSLGVRKEVQKKVLPIQQPIQPTISDQVFSTDSLRRILVESFHSL